MLIALATKKEAERFVELAKVSSVGSSFTVPGLIQGLEGEATVTMLSENGSDKTFALSYLGMTAATLTMKTNSDGSISLAEVPTL
jgi:hypothetical protein